MGIHADGFVGAVMAIEGISDATVLLHGQAGCRKGLLLSERLNPHVDRIIQVDNPFYSGCTTVPYSRVNAGDYTGRSIIKLEKALGFVSCMDYRLIALMCSPGISIVGDDCVSAIRKYGLEDRSLWFDNVEYGCEAWEGFDEAMCRVLSKVCPEHMPVCRGKVVVVGLSIMHKDWFTVRDEIDVFLKSVGLEAICYAGAGCTVEELKDSVSAEYCLVISPEYASRTVSYYSERGLKIIGIGCSPVGFEKTALLWKAVGEVTDRNIDPVLSEIDRYKLHAYSCMVALHGNLRGKTFSITAPPSMDSPLSEFLIDSFSMVRDEHSPDFVFADGYRCSVVSACRTSKHIDIGFPTSKVDFSKNPVLGLNGVMYLLDCIFR